MRIPYQLTAAMPTPMRHEQMALAIKRIPWRLQQQPINEHASITIACYGPSLADTWQNIERPIMTVSGALHYLAERGIVPDYHVEMDPRPHKVRHVTPAIKGVRYLIASVCHHSIWDALEGERVELWHVRNDATTEAWCAKHDPDSLLLNPGSTVGMAAFHVAGCLGYRHFEIHGMDGSIRDGKRHAGAHYGHAQGGQTWDAGRVTYQTSKIMANACAEVINSFRVYPMFGVFHGDGLQQALIDEEYDMDNVALAGTPKAAMVRSAKCRIIGYKDERGEIRAVA